ncbi:hypothetical protein BDY19DRAFT_997703 [Irpex rosettiformis]|uniref:Uncharacterized protein n=1 Tax=Irpex rosettiformis TaxID=378272 RepID=A0ACB8TR69_9APHY|nr:hypothetical protein BDY19DRAFT_997703 [Irpex rosettiformis]
MSGQNPTHPDLFVSVAGTGEFSISLRATKRFEINEILAAVTGSRQAERTYQTVQCGPAQEDNLQLDSDLVYANHSCEPNTFWDLTSHGISEWHVRAVKTIEVGDEITFFYPSTEWDMEQPFNCRCRTASCLGHIAGAKHLASSKLENRGGINTWIMRLSEEKDEGRVEQ